MLLSFSVPEMLPMVVNGLSELRAVAPEVDGWLWDEFGDEVDAAGERVKRTTIRASDQWSGAVGRTLHLWWKSRSPARRRLGCAELRGVEPIIVQWPGWPGAASVCLSGTWLTERGAAEVASADGFDGFDSFIRFFCPRRGDQFRGFVLSW